MANTIVLKSSPVAAKIPLPGDLVLGEIAINTTDARLFIKDGSGSIVDIVNDGKLASLIALLVTKGVITQGEADGL
jgi:hypothetical protein